MTLRKTKEISFQTGSKAIYEILDDGSLRFVEPVLIRSTPQGLPQSFPLILAASTDASVKDTALN